MLIKAKGIVLLNVPLLGMWWKSCKPKPPIRNRKKFTISSKVVLTAIYRQILRWVEVTVPNLYFVDHLKA